MAESLEYGRIAFEFLEEVDRLSDPDEVVNWTRLAFRKASPL